MHNLSCRIACLVCLLLSAASLASAQEVEDREGHVGRVLDWSYHHVVVGNGLSPANLNQAAREPRILFRLAEHNLDGHGRIAPLPRPLPRRGGVDGTTSNKRGDMIIDWSVPLGTGIVAPNMYPAKYSFNLNAAPDCTNDFVVFGLNVAGTTGGQANLVGINNLYSGVPAGICGAAPTVRFAYNGSTSGGSIRTSTVLSLDGKKIAYVESAAGSAIFHVLTWRAGDGLLATASVAPTLNGSCTATSSCLKSVTFSASSTTTFGSPWVDYANDKAFVVSDNGRVYRISCVFKCALNSNPVVDWTFVLPVPGNAGSTPRPTGPVYDSSNGRLIVADQLGMVWVINAAGTTPTLFAGPVMVGGGGCPATRPPGRTGGGIAPPCNANGGSFGIPDPVLLDASSHRFIAFSGNDGTAGASAVVAQLTEDLATIVRVHVGLGSVGNNTTNVDLHAGAFNSAFFGATPNTGRLFLCGTGNADTRPFHYWIGFTNYPAMNSTTTGLLQRIAAAGIACSPYTTVFNPNINLGGVAGHHDLLISGLEGATTNGFIITNDISTGVVTAALNFVNYPNGTSGIIVDNVSTAAQASSVYFTTQNSVTVGTCAASRCAVKLTQSALQ
jgi:hypothetical protein